MSKGEDIMNVFFNDDEIKYLKMVMQQMKYSGDLKAECILDKLRNKEIHVDDKIKVVKVGEKYDNYKKLLGKTGTVVNTSHFITVNIGGIRYYIEKEEIEVID